MTFYHPKTGERVSFTNTEDLYNFFIGFCTCGEKSQWRCTGAQITSVKQDTAFVTYGKCPVNEIAAMLGRHAATTLEPNMIIVKDF